MAETMVRGIWRWYRLPMDLKQQAGYKGVYVNPLSVSQSNCTGGTAKGNKFILSWRHAQLMMISLFKDEPDLIKAFATVVEYKPFCKYICKPTGLITYEWDKKEPEERFAELRESGCAYELQRLSTDQEHREQNPKKSRQTTFQVMCKGHVIAQIDSYYSIELEHGELLHNASRAAANLGFGCLDVLENQRGVACEQLTVKALDST